MKTILVIYTNELKTKKERQTEKRYAFNIEAGVKVGEMLDLEDYTTAVQIVEVMDKAYRYVDVSSGQLSNVRKASTKQYEIREIRLRSLDDDDVVWGTRIA